ncbi:hypothetical protein CVD28_11725 [Bacillus sp. M6-12]|uniref:hypothetical protein n=1 Tax=Bacillus sp. M6-12 TaxID=2054166 RepID=UPI000C76AA86|nr:hypothetical protein [Bacillus sp. M6-12]PLS17650.1 hypothetical protein CVD28_11725 [Bacillus sp. M6-12]
MKIDPDTVEVKIIDHLTFHEAGKLNPLIVDGKFLTQWKETMSELKSEAKATLKMITNKQFHFFILQLCEPTLEINKR